MGEQQKVMKPLQEVGHARSRRRKKVKRKKPVIETSSAGGTARWQKKTLANLGIPPYDIVRVFITCW